MAGTSLMRSSAMPLEEDAVRPERGRIAAVELAPRQRAASGLSSFLPCLAVLTALAAGIAIDRFVDPWATRKWIGLALAFTSVPFLFLRRPLTGTSRCWWRSLHSEVAGIIIASPTSHTDDLSLHLTADGPTGMGSGRCARGFGPSIKCGLWSKRNRRSLDSVRG